MQGKKYCPKTYQSNLQANGLVEAQSHTATHRIRRYQFAHGSENSSEGMEESLGSDDAPGRTAGRRRVRSGGGSPERKARAGARVAGGGAGGAATMGGRRCVRGRGWLAGGLAWRDSNFETILWREETQILKNHNPSIRCRMKIIFICKL